MSLLPQAEKPFTLREYFLIALIFLTACGILYIYKYVREIIINRAIQKTQTEGEFEDSEKKLKVEEKTQKTTEKKKEVK